jgi:hypothetical protein
LASSASGVAAAWLSCSAESSCAAASCASGERHAWWAGGGRSRRGEGLRLEGALAVDELELGGAQPEEGAQHVALLAGGLDVHEGGVLLGDAQPGDARVRAQLVGAGGGGGELRLLEELHALAHHVELRAGLRREGGERHHQGDEVHDGDGL